MVDIEKTTWAKKFKKECPESYLRAIDLATDPELEVVITKTTCTGRIQFAIESTKEPGFWLDSRTHLIAAVNLCNTMNWKIRLPSNNKQEPAITKFLADQEPLGKEFANILHDNLWNLYVE